MWWSSAAAGRYRRRRRCRPNGADTVLIERYGYLGGMGTGGLVTIIPCLSDFGGTMQIGGINQEWIERLDGGKRRPTPRRRSGAPTISG